MTGVSYKCWSWLPIPLHYPSYSADRWLTEHTHQNEDLGSGERPRGFPERRSFSEEVRPGERVSSAVFLILNISYLAAKLLI